MCLCAVYFGGFAAVDLLELICRDLERIQERLEKGEVINNQESSSAREKEVPRTWKLKRMKASHSMMPNQILMWQRQYQ